MDKPFSLFFLAILVPSYVQGKVEHEFIGCFKDTFSRAMPIALPINQRSRLITDCQEEANSRGYEVFGIQNGGECWSGPNAASTYDKYGPSTACSGGLGGPWANSVYRIKIDNAQLAGMLKDQVLNARSIDDVDVEAFVSESNKLLDLPNSGWKKDPRVADNFLSATERLLELGMSSNRSTSAKSDLMVFLVKQTNTSSMEYLVFPDYDDAAFSNHSSTDRFIVPTITDMNLTNIGGFVYDNLHEKLTTSLNKSDKMYSSDLYQDIVSKVLSCRVNPPIKFGLNTNTTILILLEHNKAESNKAMPICAFWKLAEDNESGLWSTDGCTVISSNETHTQCNCTHLTNFAILMQYKNVELDDKHERTLKILTRIGCTLSIAALLVTVVIYIYSREYGSANIHIHMNLCVAVGVAQIILLASPNGRENKDACKAVSLCLHYFCLSIFTWMLVEGIQLYKKVTSIFSTMHLIYCHVIGWGVPFPIVAIAYGARSENYTDYETCWLSPDYGLRAAFIAPVIVIIVINSVVAGITLRERLKLKAISSKDMAYKIRSSLRAFFVLLPIFGFTWLLGIFGFTSNAVAVMYLFVIFNSSQGLFIFYFHCFSNDDIRKKTFCMHRQVVASLERKGTVTTGSNKPPLQKSPSKNSEYSNKDSSRNSSAHSEREKGQALDDVRLSDPSVIITPQSLHRLVP